MTAFASDAREDVPPFEVPPGAEAPEFVSPFPVYTARQVLTLPAIPFRIEALAIPTKGLGAIAGPSGHGKGLVTEDMAFSIARGRPFRGEFALEQCPAAIVVAEGWFGIAGRQRAVYRLHGIPDDEDVPLYYVAAAMPLDDVEVAEQLAQTLRALDPRPRFLLIDTYRATNSGDENDSTDVARYVASLKRLAEAIDGFVCVIAHVPWNAERERGSTAFRAAMDWVAMVTKEDDLVTLAPLKCKDGAEFKPMRWRIEPRADSAAVVPIAATEPDRARPMYWGDIPANAQRVLTSIAKDFGDDGATTTQLQKASKVAESSFFRTIKSVKEWGFVEKKVHRHLLTPAGRGVLP